MFILLKLLVNWVIDFELGSVLGNFVFVLGLVVLIIVSIV